MNHLPPDLAALPARTGPDNARERLNRIASASGRRFDHADAPPPQPRHGTGQRGGLRLGGFGWFVIDAVAVALVLGAVLVWPPTSACREQEARIGFYAGDSLGKCIHSGVAARIDAIEQRIEMAARGSGK